MIGNVPTISDLINNNDLKRKIVLVRLDLNVDKHDLRNDFLERLAAPYETIRRLYDAGAYQVLISHRGRPKPIIDSPESLIIQNPRSSLHSLRELELYLKQKWKLPVMFVSGFPGSHKSYGNLLNDKCPIILLENLRFVSAETRNDKSFAKNLAGDASWFVNEAFGTAHRKHASIHQLRTVLPTYYGDDFVENWNHACAWRNYLSHSPTLFLLGGNKVIDKIELMKQLSRYDNLYFLLGGKLACYWWQQWFNSEGDAFVHEFDEKRVILPDNIVIKNAQDHIPTFLPTTALHILNPEDPFSVPLEDIIGWRYDFHDAKVKKIIRKVDRMLWAGPLCRYDKGCTDDSIVAQNIYRLLKKPMDSLVYAGGSTVNIMSYYHFGAGEVFHASGGNAYLCALLNLSLPALS